MRFNPDTKKSAEEIIFSHKGTRQFHPPLSFNNIQVIPENDRKHLGLTLGSKLTFLTRISKNISNALIGVGVIKYLTSCVPTNNLDEIYKMYVRPHLYFYDVIYHEGWAIRKHLVISFIAHS